MGRRMMDGKLSGAFGGWREAAAAMKEEARMMGGAMTRFVHGKLSGCWTRGER